MVAVKVGKAKLNPDRAANSQIRAKMATERIFQSMPDWHRRRPGPDGDGGRCAVMLADVMDTGPPRRDASPARRIADQGGGGAPAGMPPMAGQSVPSGRRQVEIPVLCGVQTGLWRLDLARGCQEPQVVDDCWAPPAVGSMPSSTASWK